MESGGITRAYEEPRVEDYEELQLMLGPARRRDPDHADDGRLKLVAVSDVALP